MIVYRIPAYHWLWGEGYITSAPIMSKMIGDYVVEYTPDAETFKVIVPLDELSAD